MKLSPREDEPKLTAIEVAVHDLQVVDPDLGFSFGMAGVEVWEAVIVEEHDDHGDRVGGRFLREFRAGFVP